MKYMKKSLPSLRGVGFQYSPWGNDGEEICDGMATQ